MQSKLKNDFYDYVNKDWEKRKKIPKDLSTLSSYSELHLEIEKKLRKLVEDWSKNKNVPNNPQIQQMIKFYKMLKNTKMQEKLGWTPVRNEIEIIDNLQKWEDFDQNYFLLRKISSWMPYEFVVAEDFVNNKVYTLWFEEPSLILPSKEYYERKEAKKILKTIKEVATELFVSFGKTKKEALDIIEKAYKADLKLKEIHLSSAELHKVEVVYNPYTSKDFASLSKKFDLLGQAQKLVGQEVDQIVVVNKKYLEQLDSLYSQDIYFEEVKALMLLKTILGIARYLNPYTRSLMFKISQVLSGVEKPKSITKWAYSTTLSFFSEPLSLYYGKANFSDEAKADVLKMIDKVIKVYQDRLAKNTWLTKDTAQKAIEKLNKIRPMVGYPDYIYPYFDKFIVTTYKEGGSLTSNFNHFSDIMEEFQLSLYKKEVDQNIWGMSSFEVNAYFNPLANVIVFPAGYLQAPFYDYNQNSSANYGGLGMTIGHEISHAFDNNGAQFDANGSFENWWTEADYAAFKEKTQLMIDLFDGYETPFGKINGELTVSENIADQGGIISALEAARTEADFDIEKFFENYAYCERSLTKKETAIQRLLTDPHSPAKERVNLQLMISKDFQDHYKISKEDKMYTDPKKIFEIW
ncbi:M13 family metallopeptidase [Mycoplasmopsis glycophila]|uniref:Neutral endopeptidase n=1 Tax=Mycoplasmopsis glycophila TaxID=171285 RepID=A0A449AU31_9BACT|nr:M13 family metallopeptidase [Mycoplasmopsis glycophila]VEU70029.1 Neutral endopeptidase [Mycoplasmopsis glycophila]